MNLEVAGGQELFRSDANSERWGLIPNPANPDNNPDGLPIGLSKTVISSPRFKGDGTGEFIGLTCAACHNAQLNYQGKRIRIDGGVGNMFDYMGYVQALDDAMQATLKDPAKYDRLAGRLKATAPDAKARLRKRFESEAATVHQYRTRYLLTPNAWGPSRMDAVAMIVNRLTATLTGIPENLSTGLAPSKQPFLWNAPQGLWTQWRASEQNPIFRNFGETSGVFLPIDLHSTTPAEGLFEFEHADCQSPGRREPAGPSGAAKMARGSIRQDRPRQGQGGQGALRGALRELSQRLALSLDRAQQVRQAMGHRGTDAAVVRGYGPGTVRGPCGPTRSPDSWPPICRGR